MDVLIDVFRFLATGAAWGITWLAVFGLVRKSLVQPELLRFLVFIFMVTAGVTAVAVCYELIIEYVGASDSEKDSVLARFEGMAGVIFTSQLVVICSPFWLLIRRLRYVTVILAVISICYVLMPYYTSLVHFATG